MKIKELTLYTPRLEQQREFYARVLGLEVLEINKNSFQIPIGHSTLRFEYRKAHTPYHFAFNIPSNQENEALGWLKERVGILKDGSGEIVDFPAWNAKAIYFYDADRNIGEFIARKNLNTDSAVPFGPNSLLGISEIGMPTTDIVPIYDWLFRRYGLPIYSGSTERFCAAGGEQGLFIIINTHKKKWWFPTEDQALPADFRVNIEVDGNTASLAFVDRKLSAS